ncbi:lipoprotein-releasing ABC transporter permease subunit LolC [Vibrio sp. S4M6]|uniref:lipoprotein-releasing ABC transporter permease subunit LolC n=1 Tax=Vibrio sinus TaxID=2946865 RepID=UPI002029CF1A|nr:lipoprotein-releasing ABC transporter permease subunit LolC [Vibrio sinus]MCL9782304.1 lipoprotein-releasing ABC transporter permease subunit LolC [Vibrio sinus]
MFPSISAFIGWRYLRGRSGDRFSRFVSYISTAGITIGVMSLVTVLSVMNGFEAQLKSRILGVLPQAVISQSNGETPLQSSPPPFISKLSDAYPPQPIVRGEAIIQSPSELTVGMMVGVEPKDNDPIDKYIMVGRINTLTPGSYRVFIGQTLARNLNVSVGDKLRLMVTSASQFTPFGIIPRQRMFTVAGIYNTGSDVDGQLILTNIQDAARLMRMKPDTISGWRLFFNDPFIVSELAKQPMPKGWSWSDWRAQRGQLFQAVGMEKSMMGLMLGLIVAVAAFNIVSALIMVVMEKQSEVAILKTQGMTNRQVLGIFMIQGASSGTIGSLVGGGLGVLLALNLNQILQSMGVSLFALGGQLPVVINPLQIFAVIVLAVVLSFLATLFPAYRASSVKPAEALRYE